ncbi:MAG: hypothetical protein KAQ62_22870 [Cyclobacteriaceae bacterium]|nr:hypothetical protein [Cyclobacteriaceae bacterium]
MIKTNFIMGYLGSGKTTFIQSYLNSPIGKSERILLIVNDFGKVNYDAISLEENNLEIKAITYGCLCCDLRIRFRELFAECGERKDLDRILIEPSGILIPDIITELFDDHSISKNLNLEPLIQMVDVNLFFKISKKKWPPFIEKQIAMSEKIVLNRIENASDVELAEVKKALININPKAAYFNFIKGETADKIVTESIDKIEIKNEVDNSAFLSSHSYKSIQIEDDLEFEDQKEVQDYLAEQGDHLVRAKGIVGIKRMPFLVNYTKYDFSLLPCAKSFDYGISLIFSTK